MLHTHRPAAAGILARVAVVLVVVVASALLPGAAAHARPLTALERCTMRLTPNLAQTVIYNGWEPAATFPAGGDPDNVIHPGDVVRITATGRVWHDRLGHSWGPAGDGVPAGAGWPYPGLSEISSVTRFNNNPRGWVGGPQATTALAGCSAAPTAATTRLIFGINDTVLWDNDGHWELKVELYRAPGRLAVDSALEFNQSIQTPLGEVPMVADKRTFVRVYVTGTDDGRGPLAGVTARMRVDGDDRDLAPAGPSSITASPWGSDPRTLGDSFVFELPRSATTGGRHRVEVTVTGPDQRSGPFPTVRTGTVTFSPVPDVTVFAARSSYTDVPPQLQAQVGLPGPVWPARPDTAWEPLRAMAENALPIAHLNLVELAPGNPLGSVSRPCRAVMAPAGSWGCEGYVDTRAWAVTEVDARCPGGGCWLILLQPEQGCSCGEFGTDSAGNHIINLQGETDAWEQGYTLAHEIGHGFGLFDAMDDPDYPRPGLELGPFVGVRYSPALATVPGVAVDGTITHDLMSYTAGRQWFSPYNYCRALASASGGSVACPPTMAG